MQEFLLQNQWILIIVLVWSLIWKGIALWQAARRGQKIWYVVLLICNTLGILEILYIYVFGKMQKKPQVQA
jgi:hypothetical protein